MWIQVTRASYIYLPLLKGVIHVARSICADAQDVQLAYLDIGGVFTLASHSEVIRKRFFHDGISSLVSFDQSSIVQTLQTNALVRSVKRPEVTSCTAALCRILTSLLIGPA